MLHDLHQIYRAVQAMGTLRALGLAPLAVGFVFGGVTLWSHPSPMLQWAGFGMLAVAASALCYVFISDPLQWINFLIQKLMWLGLWLVKFVFLSLKIVIVLILYLIYLISPIDLIPGDLLTLIGVLDDVLIGIGVALWAVNSRPAPEVDFDVHRVAPWLRATAAVILSVGGLYWLKGQGG